MAVFCCCSASRFLKNRFSSTKDHNALPTPPPVRLPGPLTLNPVIPIVSASDEAPSKSDSSLQLATPDAIFPVEPVELSELVVEDSDTDPELDPNAPSKNTSTLKLVKTHIKRHISQDPLPRRKGRSSVGKSQEEIERRAELKRRLHKRIQEELTTEEGQEATKISISSSQRPNGPSLEYLPGGGPRDHLEFSVLEDTKLGSQNTSNITTDPGPSRIRSLSLDHKEPGDEEIRRSSCPEVRCSPQGVKVARERSSLPQILSSPELQPQRYPSTHETSSLGSWRLIYSGTQLEEFLSCTDQETAPKDTDSVGKASDPLEKTPTRLRLPILGRSRSFSRSQSSPACYTPGIDTSSTEQSPMSTWLRSQGFRSRSPSLSCAKTSKEGCVQKAEIVYLRRWSSAKHRDVSEIDIVRPETVHLYDMDISRQLVTRTRTTPLTRSGSERDAVSKAGDGQQSSDKVEGRKRAGSEPTMTANTQSSSVYPSNTNSKGQSSGTASSYIPDLAVNPKNGFPFFLHELSWLPSYNPLRSEKSLSAGRHETPRSGLMNSILPVHPRTVSQFATSGPFSKPWRHSKLSVVEKGIASFHLGLGAPPMFGRALRDENIESTDFDSSKRSLLARLHLTFPRQAKLAARSFDGTYREDEHQLTFTARPNLTVSTPGRPHSTSGDMRQPSSYSLHTPNKPLYHDDSTAELWKQAFRAEARRRSSEARKSHQHRRHSSLPYDGWHLKDYNPPSSREHQRESSSRDQDTSSLDDTCGEILKDSTRSLARAAVLKPTTSVELAPDHKVDTARSPRPEKWATFPSHTREQRNALAGKADQVTQQDFVGDGTHEQDITDYFTEESNPSTPRKSSQSIPGKFGRAVKSGLSKLIPSRTSTSARDSTSHSHRSSQQTSVPANISIGLDRTEANILPSKDDSGVRSRVQSLENGRQDDHDNCPRLRCPVTLQEIGDDEKNKIPLSAKMAVLLQSGDGFFEPEQGQDSDTINQHDNFRSVTPAITGGHAGHERGSTATTDRFMTPLGSLSSRDNYSFHSYPQLSSRPQSRATPSLSREVLMEVGNCLAESSSVKSDSTLVRRLRLTAVAEARDIENASGNGGPDASTSTTNNTTKYGTWGGKASAQAFLTAARGAMRM